MHTVLGAGMSNVGGATEQTKANCALARVCYEQKKARLFDFINKAARDPDYALDAFFMAWQYHAKQESTKMLLSGSKNTITQATGYV
ncbi:hypothetical protein [Motilimonas pumila]|uniref:hypothetical protein n=1 Tax=Motilimonas pumila TaxID=2303987 RepID=UPI0011C48EE9|nr:hypothetical protein [Motilimonas pumila]